MNVRVIYHSGRSGNTAKVAEAIGKACGVTAEKVSKGKTEFSKPIDLLFIGSGIYMHKPHKSIRKLIEGLNSQIVKNAAAFGTYGNQLQIGDQISELLKVQEVNVLVPPFVCKGDSPGTDNKGHPDKTDLENAADFANNAVKKIERQVRE